MKEGAIDMAKPRMPAGLKARGKRLWQGLVTDDMPVDQAVLLEETCRVADLLDEIDRGVKGKEFADLFHMEVEDYGDALEVTVKVDAILMEARQQQQNLKQLLVTVRQLAPGAKVAGNGGRSKVSGGKASLSAVEGGKTGGNGRGWRAAG